jgi:dihydrofolate reductase
VYYVASSLDGFLADRDGGIAWLAPFEGTGEDYGFATFARSVDAAIVGRRTYEQMLRFPEWPHPDWPTWVCSRTNPPAERSDVHVTSAAPEALLDELHRAGHRRVWLVGGGMLAGAFRERGLLDEVILSLIPVLLGSGLPVFGGTGPQQPLDVAETRTYPSGIVQIRARPRRIS